MIMGDVKAGYSRCDFRFHFHQGRLQNRLACLTFSLRPTLLAVSLLAPLALEAMVRAVGCATAGAEIEMISAQPALTGSANFMTINTNHLSTEAAFLDATSMADALLTAMAAVAAAGMNQMMVIAYG